MFPTISQYWNAETRIHMIFVFFANRIQNLPMTSLPAASLPPSHLLPSTTTTNTTAESGYLDPETGNWLQESTPQKYVQQFKNNFCWMYKLLPTKIMIVQKFYSR